VFNRRQFAVVSRVLVLIVSGGVAVLLGGCGFIGAGDRSDTKPSAFVVSGYVSVPLTAGTVGDACTAPAPALVTSGGPVTITVQAGAKRKKVASGTLGSGLVAGTKGGLACEFPFMVRGVPGGYRDYGLAGGKQPEKIVSSEYLHAQPVVIQVDGVIGQLK
jgi:hypothetical protein